MRVELGQEIMRGQEGEPMSTRNSFVKFHYWGGQRNRKRYERAVSSTVFKHNSFTEI